MNEFVDKIIKRGKQPQRSTWLELEPPIDKQQLASATSSRKRQNPKTGGGYHTLQYSAAPMPWQHEHQQQKQKHQRLPLPLLHSSVSVPFHSMITTCRGASSSRAHPFPLRSLLHSSSKHPFLCVSLFFPCHLHKAIALSSSSSTQCKPRSHLGKEGNNINNNVEEEGDREVHCELQVVSWRERSVKAHISINADVESVWNALTDYEHLADFIPNLVWR